MTTPINDGGPAFPGINSEMTGIDSDGIERFETEQSGGMTLRDYFAAKAMSLYFDHYTNDESAAKAAYKTADAMIKARSATQ